MRRNSYVLTGCATLFLSATDSLSVAMAKVIGVAGLVRSDVLQLFGDMEGNRMETERTSLILDFCPKSCEGCSKE